MANAPIPKAPTAPSAPPKPTTAPAPAAAATAAAGAKKPKREKVPQVYCDSAEEAVTEAEKRDRGPRKPFKVTFEDKEFFVVAHNEGRALGMAFAKVGGLAEELGTTKKAKKPIGVDGVMAAIQAMPEDKRNEILAALGKLAVQK